MGLSPTWMIYAFSLGIGSSLHCLGMCGPLVMSIPFNPSNKIVSGFQFISYGISKAVMYGGMGLLPGLMGWSIKQVTGTGWISVIAGVMILIVSVIPVIKPAKIFPTFLVEKISKQFQLVLNRPQWYFFILAGILNALLPCAMILIALTAAMATSSLSYAFWFMFYFGLGTIPALLTARISKMWYLKLFRVRAQAISRWITVTVGLILILRAFPQTHHPVTDRVNVISLCKSPSL